MWEVAEMLFSTLLPLPLVFEVSFEVDRISSAPLLRPMALKIIFESSTLTGECFVR